MTIILLGGCRAGASPYDRLCEIYNSYASRPSTPESEVELAREIQRELPGVFKHYGVIANASVHDRYEILKGLARESGDASWECAAIARRYPPSAVP
ncbi:MAG: hypothetical protein OXU20_04030 [Myxococcales bacterium]|nr:hypothetical protein [Myxococcales bacterium]MDD9968021.1 hypothetical protein [Myxococcales bacterium]